MAEVFFYHLQGRPLEGALPQLLEKCLERGWRCIVQASSPERIDALDQILWTYDDASFLPHGTDRQPESARQPILLTTEEANPNGAAVRFFIERATAGDIGAYTRVIHLFDGADPDEIDHARAQWRAAKAAGHAVAYWQQTAEGRWVQR
ncbi:MULTISPECIES: DNA polymerase III subunit chi [unclassified Ancylobacter]|jgi:DNA polymerase-3 subunit chi|uniref:DNA polymerase III subunit chi n=1 Tax=unclassified Ancylobacter TaxID=2626613 RepID=UPI00226D7F46|nr:MULTISPECIES: DNA polymerase III subunit chi [unclassified Ancylobacter]WAC26874.1 DNA polymerase III subunit chi [Ancylobacter sp. SL191]WGD30761.1 DNA polymerase III subunit chi [Ancylobacter sp. WKF20]